MNSGNLVIIVVVFVLTKELTNAEKLSDQLDHNFALGNYDAAAGEKLETSKYIPVNTKNESLKANENPILITALGKKLRSFENPTRNKRHSAKDEAIQRQKSYYELISGCKLVPTDDLPSFQAVYYLCDTRLDWHSAEQYCNNHQMNLAVTINNYAFTSLVRSLYHSYIKKQNYAYYRAWLSGTDLGSVGKWYWAKSRAPILTNLWYSGEPNNVNGTEHCLGLGQVGSTSEFGYFDFDCQGQYHFLCEVAINL